MWKGIGMSVQSDAGRRRREPKWKGTALRGQAAEKGGRSGRVRVVRKGRLPRFWPAETHIAPEEVIRNLETDAVEARESAGEGE